MKQQILSLLLKVYAGWTGISVKPHSNSVLLLPPYSPGSYGDAAVVTSFVENLVKRGVKRIALIKYKDSDDWSFIKGITEYHNLEDFFHYDAWRIRFSLCHWISEYEKFFILGTDVIDGYYSPRDSLQRIYLANLGAQTGRPTRIVSFSFNAHPEPACVNELLKLPKSVSFFVRDPISLERLQSRLHCQPTLTADIAFLLDPISGGAISKEIIEWIDQQKENGAVVAGINANHVLVEKYADIKIDRLVSAYQKAIEEISEHYPEIRFLFIPHDVRGEFSDVSIANAIYLALPEHLKRLSKIVPSPCHPAEIKYIVRNLEFVLSGKMHLAIACLSQEVPVACIAYQDKFEGLFQHFKMGNMTLAPEEILEPGKLSQFFLERFIQRQELSQQIKQRLPEVVRLAEKNLV